MSSSAWRRNEQSWFTRWFPSVFRFVQPSVCFAPPMSAKSALGIAAEACASAGRAARRGRLGVGGPLVLPLDVHRVLCRLHGRCRQERQGASHRPAVLGGGRDHRPAKLSLRGPHQNLSVLTSALGCSSTERGGEHD